MTEEQVFLAALDLPNGADRAAYLDKVCGQNSDLRRQVEELLAAHECSGQFLDEAAAEQMAAGPQSPTAQTVALNAESDDARADGKKTNASPSDDGRRPALPVAVHPARFPRPAGALRDAPGARQGRLRHRVPGLRRDAAARGRGQGDGPADRHAVPGAQALPARGPVLRRRFGTRTWCKCTRSANDLCPTWRWSSSPARRSSRDSTASARSTCPRCCGSAGRSPRGWPRPTRAT